MAQIASPPPIPGAPPGIDAGAPEAEALKAGVLGARHISAMVIATAAPIAGVVGLVPIAIILGNGVGTPGALFLIALLLGLFAVPFVRVIPYIQNTGAFYAYIANGLGRSAGLASAYVILTAYLALACSTIGGFGFFARDLIFRFTGVSVHWALCALVATALAAGLGYLGVALAAKLLIIVLLLEVIVLAVVDIAILGQEGLGAFSLDAINPEFVFSGSLGIAAIYAFGCFLGFEGTAIYSEEAKKPLRTIPRATYTVVTVVGLFYGLSAWAMLAGAGFDNAVARSSENPGLFVFALTDQYVGSAWSDVLSILVVTSLFAGVLAFLNAAARYFFALSRDGVLPRVLAHVDARRGTPAPAIGLVAVIIGLVVIVFAVAGLDPLLELATSMTGLGTIGLVALLTITSIAIMVFFLRRGDRRISVTVVPLVAAVLLGACTVAGIANYGSLTGSTSTIINTLPWVYLPIAALGFGVAEVVRKRSPEKYAAMGSTRVH